MLWFQHLDCQSFLTIATGHMEHFRGAGEGSGRLLLLRVLTLKPGRRERFWFQASTAKLQTEDSSSGEAKCHHQNPLRCLTGWGSCRAGNMPTVATGASGGPGPVKQRSLTESRRAASKRPPGTEGACLATSGPPVFSPFPSSPAPQSSKLKGISQQLVTVCVQDSQVTGRY